MVLLYVFLSLYNEVERIFIFPHRYYANCGSATLKVFILHKVESVYFFYSNLVLFSPSCTLLSPT